MKRKRTFQRVLAMVSAAVMVASCAGCGNNAGTKNTAGNTSTAETKTEVAGETQAEKEAGNQVLRVATATLPTTLDANASVSNAGIQVYYNIYDTLIMRDTSADTPTFLPGLAESWTQTGDLEWEFKLRDGVKFQDGTTMDADDVCYSMNRVINNEDASYQTANSYLLSNFEKFEAVDDLTVKAYTKNPEPLIENLLSDPNAGISSKEYCESVGLEQAGLSPITTGPYKVVSFDPGHSVELERFDDYWGEKAPFEKIEITCIPEIISRITALQNGEVDFITNIPPDQESMLEGNTNVKLIGGVLPMYHVYRLNMTNELMKDSNLRAALDYAIDRQKLVDTIWHGKAVAATGYQFDEYGDLYLEGRDNEITYDVEKAKEFLAKSNYNGETVRIYNQTDYYTHADLAAQAVIEMWKAIGVNAELVEAESLSTFSNEEQMIRTWSNPLYYQDPMGVLERHWSPDGAQIKTGHFVASEEYTKQFNIARYSTDKEARREALGHIYDYFRAETPFIYLYKPYESVAVSSSVDYKIPTNARAYTLGFRAGEISMN